MWLTKRCRLRLDALRLRSEQIHRPSVIGESRPDAPFKQNPKEWWSGRGIRVMPHRLGGEVRVSLPAEVQTRSRGWRDRHSPDCAGALRPVLPERGNGYPLVVPRQRHFTELIAQLVGATAPPDPCEVARPATLLAAVRSSVEPIKSSDMVHQVSCPSISRAFPISPAVISASRSSISMSSSVSMGL